MTGFMYGAKYSSFVGEFLVLRKSIQKRASLSVVRKVPYTRNKKNEFVVAFLDEQGRELSWFRKVEASMRFGFWVTARAPHFIG